MTLRFARIEKMIYQAIARSISREIKDPRVHRAEAVVVTRVKVSRDLSVARILVAVPGDDELRREVLDTLRKSAGHLRCILARKLDLRRVPRLDFRLDQVCDSAARVEQILLELKKEAERGTGDPDRDREEEL